MKDYKLILLISKFLIQQNRYTNKALKSSGHGNTNLKNKTQLGIKKNKKLKQENNQV